MKPLGSNSARAIAATSGLVLGAFTVFQYARVVGGEPLLWLNISPGLIAATARSLFGIATLLITFISFERACREIGPLTTAAWSVVGSGLLLVLVWSATWESTRPSYASDTRDALQILAAPFAITFLGALLACQVLMLLRYSPLRSAQRSSRGLIVGAALLVAVSILIGLGPFRFRLGEWHYVLALWAGDAACIGFLAASRIESLMTPKASSVLIRLTTGAIGIGMMVVAVLM
jgi:hypothetical protein